MPLEPFASYRPRFAVPTLLALFAAVWLVACEAPPSTKSATETAATEKTGADEKPVVQSDTRVVASYGDKKMTVSDFEAMANDLNPRARRSLDDETKREQFVENHVLQQLVYDEGKRLGYLDDPTIKDQLRDLERRLVIQRVMMEHQGDPVSDDEVRRYYDEHREEFKTDRVKASHILVKDEALAKEILAKLQADPSSFAKLAEEYSIDHSNSSRGGELGFFPRGRMVKEFEDAAFALTKDGEISGIVKTRFGFHIIRRDAREDGAEKPFEEVASQIRVKLINQKRRESTQNFIDKLKSDARYTLNRDVLETVKVPGDDKPGNAVKGH